MKRAIKLAEMERLERSRVEDTLIDASNRGTDLGPRLVAVRCEVVFGRLTCGAGYSRFERCVFSGMPADELYWIGCELIRCRFLCDLDAHTFGPREPEHGGFLQACDFSQCSMDDCQFYCSRPEEQILPGWPMFAVSGLKDTATRLRGGGKWPKQAISELDVWCLAKQPLWGVSNAERIAKRTNVEVEALWDALLGVEGVYIAPRPAPPKDMRAEKSHGTSRNERVTDVSGARPARKGLRRS